MLRTPVVILCVAAHLAAQGQQPDAPLPVKRVVLYKSGVGYFEHLGQVRNTQDVAIPFTSAQLNDVLKSLTVLDLGGGRVSGVTYSSTVPVGRQLDDLRLPSGDKTTLVDLLGSLRGALLEIRSGTAVATGRLLSVERRTETGPGGTTVQVDSLSMITGTGEVKSVELTPGFSFRLLEKSLTSKLDRYLDLVASRREPDFRRMIVSTSGTGDRSLFVSYISEVPVWKTTYRLVLDRAKAADSLLQGWAIVDNTVGQDWTGVELSLVAGAPQSFIQELSTPYYTRRPVVPLPEQMMGVPQTHQSTLVTGGGRLYGQIVDATGAAVAGASVRVYSGATLVGAATSDANGNYTIESLPDGPGRIEVQASGFGNATQPLTIAGQPLRRDVSLHVGSVTETAMVQSDSAAVSRRGSVGGARQFRPPSAPAPSEDVRKFSAGTPSAAATQTLGDLFEYKLKQPITIQRNQSALVPIVNARIAAEKVSLWNEALNLTRPRRALWLTNTTGLTLDGGAFSVVEDEAFAGEGIIEPVRPGEKRLASYAVDLAVTASADNHTGQERITRVRLNRGTLVHTREVREKKTYTFRNEDSQPRTILVEHPVRSGWELRSQAKPAETSARWMRFRVPVESKQTATLQVEEGMAVDSSILVSDVTNGAIVDFLAQKSITPAIEQALRRVAAQKAAVDAAEAKIESLRREKERIFGDQQRLRANMSALKGSAEEKALIQRYTGQLAQQETRLENLEAELSKAEKERAAAQEALTRLAESLEFDAPL